MLYSSIKYWAQWSSNAVLEPLSCDIGKLTYAIMCCKEHNNPKHSALACFT